jgi:hypothetical protein
LLQIHEPLVLAFHDACRNIAWKASQNSAHCTWLAGRVAVKLAHHALASLSNC